jgi:hypothetical protein
MRRLQVLGSAATIAISSTDKEEFHLGSRKSPLDDGTLKKLQCEKTGQVSPAFRFQFGTHTKVTLFYSKYHLIVVLDISKSSRAFSSSGILLEKALSCLSDICVQLKETCGKVSNLRISHSMA